MLNVIANIGKIAYQMGSEDVLDFFIADGSKYKVLVGINLNLAQKNIEILLLKASEDNGLSRKVLKEFLYLPSERGHCPQFVVTTPKLIYLLTQTLPNLQSFLPEGKLKEKLEKILEVFWITTADSKQIIDRDYFKEFAANFDHHEENIASFVQNLEKAIAEKMHAKAKEIIYTLLVDGEVIAKDSEYQQFVVNKNLESAFEGKIHSQKCSNCDREEKVSTDTTRLLFKFYMTDKINFASYFDGKNFYRAVSLCKKCYRDVIIGERWIDANLKTRIGNFQVYVLPQIIFHSGETQAIYEQLLNLPNQFNTVKNLKELKERERTIIVDFEHSPFIFNFLFYRKSQSAFKILTLIKDVPPSRIVEMAMATTFVDNVASKHNFPSSSRFDLDQIYWLFPMKRKGADHLEYRKLLQFFDNLFNAYEFSPESLYNIFTQLAHIHKTETYSLYQYKRPNSSDWALKNDILKWNLFLLFLKKQNLFNGGKFMNAKELQDFLPKGIPELFADLNYNQVQQSLALLGYVLGAVANAQYREGLENKPVLDKVNYQGMSEEKVIRLFNELSEKIRQYKRHIGYAERWWSAAMKLYLSSDRKALTASERVFYILSGYAFNLLGSGKKEETEEESNENE